MASSRTKVWTTAAAVTGALLAVAAAPGRTPDTVARQDPGAPAARDAAVTLLVGRALDPRALDRGPAPAARWCAAPAFASGPCGTWREQRVRATAHGTADLLWNPSLGSTGTLPTAAGGPLEIALAHAEAGRLT
ncbi:hypothetical protein, partial [Streptomyces katrae]